jgi:hypothetical protein
VASYKQTYISELAKDPCGITSTHTITAFIHSIIMGQRRKGRATEKLAGRAYLAFHLVYQPLA